MKKHPIDELFGRKLSQFEVNPSEDLRARFLAQLKEEEKPKGVFVAWQKYFALAASVAFLAGIAWFNWPDDGLKAQSSAEIAEKAPELKTKAAEVLKEGQESLPERQEEPQALALNKERKSLASKEQSKQPKKSPIVRAEGKEAPALKVPATGVVEMDERIPDQLTLALQESQPKSKLKQEAEAQTGMAGEGLFREAAGETIIIVSSDFDTNEEILIPQVDVDSPMTLAEAEGLGEDKKEKDASFLSKMFVGFKQVKHGELPEAEDQGEAVARSDEGLIQHEARQMRQRIQWIKDKLSKQ
ncbi:hypothetical protein LAG90_09980 [Marinilongibacter aquaticus]|uniref:hypothetical protein n=1 Tax=Marinilongibacter aquaticus TaxID=2975157 RepID=UPI0021BD50B9|nr:hypothetical protein [Marinilongibacter aquaticus]UBM60958.1 hypothetical protein LAG90_09980 [Marinilongibacter aquaticus]